MMTIGSLKYVTSQTTLGFSSNDFVRIIQKKTIDSTQVCESFDQSITWAHPAYGSSPVQVTYQNLWNDATNPKSVKMTVTMEPGYRPQMYNDLYHFIQISPSETYDRFESIVDNSTHLTSTEMTMLYSDVNFAAKTSQLEEYCRIQIPAADISQNNDGTLSFEVIVTLNQLKTCAEQRHVLTYKRTSNTGSTRCKYVTHPSTDIIACGNAVTSTTSDSEQCMAACDGDNTCNAFTFDTLSGNCSLYPGALSDLVYGNFDVSNTADNPHCKLAVPASGTNLTAYLLDPHTVQGGCYEYLLADNSIPTRRRLQDAPSTARRLVGNHSAPVIIGRKPSNTCQFTTVSSSSPFLTGGSEICEDLRLKQIFNADYPGELTISECQRLCSLDPRCDAISWLDSTKRCEHFTTKQTPSQERTTSVCTSFASATGSSYEIDRSDTNCWEAGYDAQVSRDLYNATADQCGDVTLLSSQMLDYRSEAGWRPTASCGNIIETSTQNTIDECFAQCQKNELCMSVQYDSDSKDCKLFPTGFFDGFMGSNNNVNDHCVITKQTGTTTYDQYGAYKIPYWVSGANNECFPVSIAGLSVPASYDPGSTPDWHSNQAYNNSTLNIDFVVSSVQCKCPDGDNAAAVGAVGGFLEHCDVPFYQKVTFTRTEDEDHTAASGTLIISDSQLYLLPEQDVQTSNDLEALTLNGTAFNFGSATVGIQDPNACKPENSTTTEYVNCGGDKAFIKPYQREEHMTISFKSDSALQMQKVTLKTFFDPNKNVDATTNCTGVAYNGNMLQGNHDNNQYKCTEETFAAPADVFWQYAPNGYDGNTPSQAYSFTFKGDVTSGITAGLDRAYQYYNDSDLVLNVVIEVTVSQAGARPSRRRLGLSSLRLMDGNSRNLRMLGVDEGVERVVLSLPVIPTTGDGGLVVLSNNGSSSTNGTVLTIPQTIVNQYTTHHSEDEKNNFWIVSIVLSSVAIALIASGMLIWFLRNRHQHGHQGVSTKHGMKVTNDRFEAYGEQTPMLSMRGLHVA
jgi:hypothetical protein